jgi:hypothetical protein
MPKLIQEIKLLWTTSITQDFCKKLSNPKPKSIQQMMAAKGDDTNNQKSG